MLYVDDGSEDDTWAIIQSLISADANAGATKLSRISERKPH
ncbi:hypothetical protein [Rhodanobacter sp. L36]|nr:hypothetical protein [Rhodanobacter sp. L36]